MLKKSVIISLWIVASVWIIYLIDPLVFFIDFTDYGIHPRRLSGLPGILTSPFLHANWQHLLSNTFPLLILSFLMIYFYNKLWVPSTILCILLGGLIVWLIGRSGTNHIGASGLIFSYIGFLIAAGIFSKNIKSLLIALLVLFLYGGALIQGIIPHRPGVSWEGHLFGAVSGIIVAYLYKKKLRQLKPGKK